MFPQKAETFPQKEESLPQKAETFPQKEEPLPLKEGMFPKKKPWPDIFGGNEVLLQALQGAVSRLCNKKTGIVLL